MRKRQLVAAVSAAMTAASALAMVVLSATGADAAPAGLGTLTVTPAKGLDVSAPTVTTSGGCPTTADGYNLTVTGPGGWAKGLTAAGTSDANMSHTGGFSIPFANTFLDIAKNAGITTITPGRYDISANCVDSLTSTVKGNFTGAVWFTDATHYQNTDPSVPPTTTTPPTVPPVTTTPTTVPPVTTTPTTAGSTATTTTSGATTTPVSGTDTSATTTVSDTSATTIPGGTATDTPTSSVALAGNGTGTPPSRLASTGVSVALPLVAGLVLIAGGAVALVTLRRRRALQAHGEN